MRAKSIELAHCARFDRAINEASFYAKQKHVVARHLDKKASAPAEPPRTQQIPKTGVLIHLLKSPHIDITHKTRMSVQHQSVHPSISLVPMAFQNVEPQLPKRA
jgi:hypothetical protein